MAGEGQCQPYMGPDSLLGNPLHGSGSTILVTGFDCDPGVVKNAMDGCEIPFPIEKPDSAVNTNKQWCPMVSCGGFRPSTGYTKVGCSGTWKD